MSNPGMIAAWGGHSDTIPLGWLPCDGTAVKQSDYPALYMAIGNSWGSNAPSGEFFLPDLRGYFLRGVDGGAGRDPDAAHRYDPHTKATTGGVGSVQDDTFQNHNHSFKCFPNGTGNIAAGKYWDDAPAFTDMVDATKFRAGSETRPKNAYVYFIIAAQ